MQLQTKTWAADIKAADNGVIEGYASTYDRDLVDDKIEPGAYKLAPRVKGLWQHRWDEPIGIPDLTADDKGLFVSMKLMTKGVQRAKEAYNLAKAGLIDAFSIGFFPRKWEYDADGLRIIKELEIFEVSLVTFPANPNAVVMNVKSVPSMQDWPLASRDREWNAREAVIRLREKLGATEEPNADYRRCFFWFDEQEADNFGAYKMPYCDVIDGEIRAVPRAIFASAGVLEGARGGVDIPEGDRERLKRVISRWYRRMSEEFDDPSIVAPWDREKGLFPTYEEVKAVYGDVVHEEIEAALALRRLAKQFKSL